ncbi:MAG: recombinase family protein [Candidatus Nomurabacteria bacterium]|nr:recombinase family protein [Candidatus Nomurabacteria bacterium]
MNKKTAPLVRAAFERYARGDQRLDDIAEFLFQNGIKTHGIRNRTTGKKSAGGKKWTADRVKNMFNDIFYYGDFKYAGEIYAGKQPAIIDKLLFDKVQRTLADRGRVHKPKSEPLPFNRLVRCGNCGCFVTGSHKVRQQKNGNVHHWVYYRCSHNKKSVPCREPELRDYDLAEQLVTVLRSFTMPCKWGDFFLSRLADNELVTKNDTDLLVARHSGELDEVNAKIKRLFDAYLDGDIDQDSYRERRADLLSNKKSLEAKIERVLVGADFWVEPMRNWVKNAVSLCEIGFDSQHADIASAFRKIDGSNLFLQNKKIAAAGGSKSHFPFPNTAAASGAAEKNSWQALCAANANTALSGGKIPKDPDLVHHHSRSLHTTQARR